MKEAKQTAKMSKSIYMLEQSGATSTADNSMSRNKNDELLVLLDRKLDKQDYLE